MAKLLKKGNRPKLNVVTYPLNMTENNEHCADEQMFLMEQSSTILYKVSYKWMVNGRGSPNIQYWGQQSDV